MFPPLSNNTVLRDRYKLTNIVGHGGMGCVYRAEDLRLPGRLTAIKELQIEFDRADDKQQAHQQFLREASILAQLDHPNLPKVSDYFTEKGREYLVMDYVPGKDLKQILDEYVKRNEQIPEAIVLDWAEQIFAAISYLHQQSPPVVHRDIKPANIKLTPDNRIKLVDFGLVKLLAPDDRTITMLQGRGTALYTPLEQYGGDAGHTAVQTDLYALGATFYHLLTNLPPAEAKARFLKPSELRAPRELNGRVSDAVNDAIMWAIEMHPDDRPESAEMMRATMLGEQSRPVSYRTGAATQASVVDALAANQVLVIVAMTLFVVAVFLTLAS